MHLLQLPNELLQVVADNLSTDADLNALIQTHSRFYHLLETYLLEHNARYGESSALVWAAAHGQIEIAKKSLGAKADANTLGRLHHSIIKLSFRTCPSIALPYDPVYEWDFPDRRCRSTPIMLAAVCGHKEIVELLFHHGADINRVVGGVCTPLLGAIGHGHVDVVEYLLVNGADLDVDLDGYFNYNALELAAHEGHVEVVKALLRHGADPNKSSPLALATGMGRLEAARVLLEAGADIGGEAVDNVGTDAFFNAVHRDKAAVVSLLIEYGVSPERRDNDGMTPLAYAAYYRHDKVIEVLLSHGANVNALVHGFTALSFAIDEGKVPAVKLLLENGADLTMTNEPFLLRTLKRSHDQEADTVIVELLLNHRADPNCCDRKGRTPLFLATVKQNLDIMRLLLVHGANPNREDEEINLLSWAFLKGHADMVNLLLAYGARESWRRGDHIMIH
ncbi:ankyrin repeat-containing domain protein [Aspergillus caelatus]|uniref:Ankyrin repeat-containing domain protein n=1 Tax=Aspergillus caelatus TaxID=61420 RepID=A0A5N6ZMD7_9EURO|nr:ankyrin repeat-containing domain protein [Aspergillus caelatus]KAE8358625.1 ankyrin repeat-containing domain protein [Aspergillus caelatus]